MAGMTQSRPVGFPSEEGLSLENGEDASMKDVLAQPLLAWYERHARTLPWRIGPKWRRAGVRPDPYRVWLSEVMLQQTTVKAVGEYFAAFTARWPDMMAFAAAPEEEVMAAWAGLGYYSRARNLVACARRVAEDYGGMMPRKAEELAKLPGIGPYTSASIAAIAFDEPVPVVDGNVERVVSRLFAIDRPLPQAKSEIRETLRPLVPQDRPGEFAEAMMDLGATICSPKRPACALCPLNMMCRAHGEQREEAYPVKAPKRAKAKKFAGAFVALRDDGKILLSRRPPKGLLGGMSEVPTGPWQETPVMRMPTPPLAGPWRKIAPQVSHIFTHIDLKVTIWQAALPSDTPAPEGFWWHGLENLKEAGLPTVMAKIVEAAIPGATKARATR